MVFIIVQCSSLGNTSNNLLLMRVWQETENRSVADGSNTLSEGAKGLTTLRVGFTMLKE